MRETWSLLVIAYSATGSDPTMKVLDFKSPNWADTAYTNIREGGTGRVIVYKLY